MRSRHEMMLRVMPPLHHAGRMCRSPDDNPLGNAYKPPHEGHGYTGFDVDIMALNHAVGGIVLDVRRHNDMLAAFAARVR